MTMLKTLFSLHFLSLLALFILPTPLSSFPDLGLDTFHADQARRDPSAANDSFHALPSALRKRLAASQPSPDHAALVSYLLSFQISVPVYVKLVGPFSDAAPSLLNSFVSAALSSARFYTVGFQPHHLAVGHFLHLDPSLSPLASQISAAIHRTSTPLPLRATAPPSFRSPTPSLIGSSRTISSGRTRARLRGFTFIC